MSIVTYNLSRRLGLTREQRNHRRRNARELRELRELARITQGELAREIGISQSMVSSVERGETAFRSDIEARIRKVLNSIIQKRATELQAATQES
ncbi:MAG: helix-turn-helix domain-containing protein [Acidobacteria bacterium]|nr:helix-turn-helix domain-containing protein [Acidobacteriota bacterium]